MKYRVIRIVAILIFLLLIFACLAGWGWRYYLLYQRLEQVSQELVRLSEMLSQQSTFFGGELIRFKVANQNLANLLNIEQGKNQFFANQISGIKNTVNTLEKLSQLDKELLKKYSKVYFLNENYLPKQLSVIGREYTYNQNQIYQIHTQVQPYLYQLLDAAESAGVHLRVISAYRSFDDQANLKSNYKMLYGSGANQFSADQGYSEHQLGTTVDLTTPELGGEFYDFKKTSAYQWLRENAHKYGFILSYPENNQYYIFEPWHWRFVGVKLATELHNRNKYFYDLDQREIDNYLIYIFD